MSRLGKRHDPKILARFIIGLCKKKRIRFRYTMPTSAWFQTLVRKFLPFLLYSKMILGLLKKLGPKKH